MNISSADILFGLRCLENFIHTSLTVLEGVSSILVCWTRVWKCIAGIERSVHDTRKQT